MSALHNAVPVPFVALVLALADSCTALESYIWRVGPALWCLWTMNSVSWP